MKEGMKSETNRALGELGGTKSKQIGASNTRI
jgi:hypothetical protein